MQATSIALLAAVLLPASAAAQAELSALLGYRAGTSTLRVEAEVPGIACLLPPCVEAEARTPESEALTLALDLPLRPGWLLEALLSRQDARLRLDVDVPGEAGPATPERFELTFVQLGVMRRWERHRRAPFLVAGVGLAWAETSAAVLSPPIRPPQTGRRLGSEEGLSLSLGGGVRLPLGRRWGVRVEARGHWFDLPAELGGALTQVGLGVGLSARL